MCTHTDISHRLVQGSGQSQARGSLRKDSPKPGYALGT